MNSACTVDLIDTEQTPQAPTTRFWRGSHEQPSDIAFDLFHWPTFTSLAVPLVVSSVTAMTDLWLLEQLRRDAVVTIRTATDRMLIADLGWSRVQALETRMRLRTFEEDWDAPGMEAYDEL